MKNLLLKMFHEVDDDNNGYLTFDEFQVHHVSSLSDALRCATVLFSLPVCVVGDAVRGH